MIFDAIDAAYLLSRARDERDKASLSHDEMEADRHLQLAARYEEKALQLKSLVDTD